MGRLKGPPSCNFRGRPTFGTINGPSPFNFKTQTPTAVDIKFCLELGVTANVSVGVRVLIDGVVMAPAVPAGNTWDTSFVVHPALTAAVGNIAGLSTYCFNFLKSPVGSGTHTLIFHWAVSSGATVWGRRYTVTVWAAKIKP